jgi:acyl carrier protein
MIRIPIRIMVRVSDDAVHPDPAPLIWPAQRGILTMYPPPSSTEWPMNPIADECIALIAKQKSITPEQITLDTPLDDLALDSLDRVSLAFDLEEKYNIEIPESQLGQIKTVRDMVSGIEEALRHKNAQSSANA